jgi:hypothetical protein
MRFGLALTVAAAFLSALAACSGSDDAASQSSNDTSAAPFAAPLDVSDSERADIVTKKATCPFAGTAVAMKRLLLFNTGSAPLARLNQRS